MNPIDQAAALLWPHWLAGTRLAALPAQCRPENRTSGYAVQAALARESGQPVVGWKIAATSAAGQAHINVDGPIAGRLLANRVLAPGATVSLKGNAMLVAEVEFAFRMGQNLPPRAEPYGNEEVLQAVDSLHLSVEIPDSRFEDFTKVGAPSLIADCACHSWLVVGPAVVYDWRSLDLAACRVQALIDAQPVAQGSGAAALGDPRLALAWLANELRQYGPGLTRGDLVTTGTCIVPAAIKPGEHFEAHYGALGSLALSFD
jgi:2-keto-4-pentenoate hydratase